MFDCHFDLLMYIYMSRHDVKKIKEYCNKVFRKDNITGGIFNICYTSPEQVEQSLKIKKEEIDVIENLKVINEIIEEHEIIPKDVKYLLGIEGLDYLKNIDDIDELYKLGLRSTNIVWNNPNKFGGGAKAEEEIGLTNLGKKLIEKLVKGNIAIDLSHANEKTFWRNYRRVSKVQKTRLYSYNPCITFKFKSNM